MFVSSYNQDNTNGIGEEFNIKAENFRPNILVSCSSTKNNNSHPHQEDDWEHITLSGIVTPFQLLIPEKARNINSNVIGVDMIEEEVQNEIIELKLYNDGPCSRCSMVNYYI